MAVARARAVAVAVSKAKARAALPVCKNHRRVKTRVDRYAVLRAFLRHFIGEQVEIGTIAGVVIGTLTDVEVNYLQLVDTAGNLVFVPLRNVVYAERL